MAFVANVMGWTINGVQGQPALLYLVPCTLIPFTVSALVRGGTSELMDLWNGPRSLAPRERQEATSETASQEGGDEDDSVALLAGEDAAEALPPAFQEEQSFDLSVM